MHSDLTTLIQVADLVAYIICWGFRFPPVTKPDRPELHDLAESVALLRYRTTSEAGGNPDFGIWSFTLIDALRGREEREAEEKGNDLLEQPKASIF